MRSRISPCLALGLLFLGQVAFAEEVEPLYGTVTQFRPLRAPRDCLDARSARAHSDLLAAIPTLVKAVEDDFPESMVRARAVALARAIVYYANLLPPSSEGAWPRTKQIKEAAQLVKGALDARLATARAKVLTRTRVAALLSETLVRAHVENRILGTMRGNEIDVRRTDRVLREFARRFPLTCEVALVSPAK